MPEWLVYVRTADFGEKKRKYQDALAIVYADAEVVDHGVSAMNGTYKDDWYYPQFAFCSWDEMDRESRVYARLGLAETSRKAMDRDDHVWKVWRAACRDIWGEAARFKDADQQRPAAPRIGAGKAFAAAMKDDPATEAAWERARAKLQAYAKVLKAADAGNADELRQRLDDMAEAIRDGLRASGEQLAGQGFSPPATIEDWEHLARIVEIPLETIRSGNLTAREIHACALAWADRQKIRAKLAANTHAPTSTQSPAPGAKVEAEDAGDVGGPTEDPHDNRVAWWAGKRIYLGNDTEVSRLFWLLAKPVGAAANLAQVQRAIDGMETTRDMRPDEVRKTAQRLRKVISKLRAALREAGLDDHVLIVKDGPQADPQYSMVPRFGK